MSVDHHRGSATVGRGVDHIPEVRSLNAFKAGTSGQHPVDGDAAQVSLEGVEATATGEQPTAIVEAVGIDQIVVESAVHAVGSGIAVNRVAPTAAVDEVVARSTAEDVIAGTSVDRHRGHVGRGVDHIAEVRSLHEVKVGVRRQQPVDRDGDGMSLEGVEATATGEQQTAIVEAVGEDHIVVGSAVHAVGSGTADDLVIVVAAQECVISVSAPEPVVSIPAQQSICARASGEEIVPRPPIQQSRQRHVAVEDDSVMSRQTAHDDPRCRHQHQIADAIIQLHQIPSCRLSDSNNVIAIRAHHQQHLLHRVLGVGDELHTARSRCHDIDSVVLDLSIGRSSRRRQTTRCRHSEPRPARASDRCLGHGERHAVRPGDESQAPGGRDPFIGIEVAIPVEVDEGIQLPGLRRRDRELRSELREQRRRDRHAIVEGIEIGCRTRLAVHFDRDPRPQE